MVNLQALICMYALVEDTVATRIPCNGDRPRKKTFANHLEGLATGHKSCGQLYKSL